MPLGLRDEGDEDADGSYDGKGAFAALQEITRIHVPVRGEATSDPNRYCSVCRNEDWSAARWPCKTVRIARAALKEGEEQQSDE